MRDRLCLLAAIVVAAAVCGCCERSVWRCPDGQCGILSGRFDGCSTCTNCEGCGQLLGHCRCHPFTALRRRITCGEGCGDIYWDEWHSDPPAPCDPCDEFCGNFIGSRCCPPPWLQRRDSFLLGRRGCGDCGGACEGGAFGCHPGDAHGGDYGMTEAVEWAPTTPTLAPPAQPLKQPAARSRATPRPEPAPADEAPMLQGTRRMRSAKQS